MRILVTGGCGVVGSHFAASSKQDGHDVVVIDRCPDPRNLWIGRQLKNFGVEVWVRSLQSCSDYLRDTIGGFDLVLHAAAYTGIPASATNPTADWSDNVDATLVLLEALRNSPKRPKTVVLSSVKPYSLKGFNATPLKTRFALLQWVESAEEWFDDGAVDESCPLDPDEPYAASKMAQSAACVAYARSYDLPLTVFRCSNLYGPAPCHGARHGWLTWFCISAALRWSIEIQGTGKQTRDMLHARDVRSAVLHAAERMDVCAGELFNLGGGSANTISVIEAARELEKLSGCMLTSAPGRRFEDDVFVTDTTKFRETTGWEPRVGVQSGLRHVYEWAVEHREELAEIYGEAS